MDGAEFESAFGVSGRCAHLALGGGRIVSATARKQLGDDGVVCWLAMHIGSLKMIECDAIRFCAIGTLCTVLSGSLSCPYPLSEFCQLYHLDRKCPCPLLEGSSPTIQQSVAHQQSKVLLTDVVGSGNPRQKRKRLRDCWRLAKASACCCRYCCRYMDRPTVCQNRHAERTAPRNFHFSGPNR